MQRARPQNCIEKLQVRPYAAGQRWRPPCDAWTRQVDGDPDLQGLPWRAQRHNPQLLNCVCIDMPNLAAVLKAEISRLARKELRLEIDGLRKTVAAQRADLAGLKRKLLALERASTAQARVARRAKANQPVDDAPAAHARAPRFTAAGLTSLRQKLGLSAADMGLLVGSSGQSIYAWEAEKSTPRAKNVAAIAALRGLGKRAVMARLAALRAG